MAVAVLLFIVGCLVHLESSYGELVLVHAMFRHGNRAPTDCSRIYPNDPHEKLTFEPEGRGGLTNEGKMSSYKLGGFFRSRYGKFLGPTYSSKIIRFRADEVERVVMTGELVAAGMFPPAKGQSWNANLNWQPIPVWAPSFKTDYLYNGMFCSNYKKIRTNLEKTDQNVKSLIKSAQKDLDYMSKQAGAVITHQKAFFLRQLLNAEQDVGLKLPAWAETIVRSGKLDKIATNELIIQSFNQQMQKILAGTWLKELLANIDNRLNKNSNDKYKAYMYSTHELNIAPVLVALNVSKITIPSYSSALIFELHQQNNNLFIKIIRKEGEQVEPIIIDECGKAMCPLDEFKRIVAPLIPIDSAALCGNTEKSLY